MLGEPAGNLGMTRVPLVEVGEPGAGGELLRRVAERSGSVPYVYQALAAVPQLLEGWLGMSWAMRDMTEPGRDICELVTLRVAQLSGCESMWRGHFGRATAAGLSEEHCYGLSNWRDSDLYSPAARVALALADAMTVDVTVSDDVWAGVDAQFDPVAAVNLVVSICWSASVARINEAFRLPLTEGQAAGPGFARP